MTAPLPAADLVARFRADLEALTSAEPDMLGIAVSGGPDSLALLLLAAAALPGRVQAATVDHGLRAESAAEARLVASVCNGLGVPHAVLSVEVNRDKASLQRAAREARYHALASWLDACGTSWLATAHHVDDQAETLVMRLLRGSGVGGLAGVRRSGPIANSSARLIRPVLGWRRETLAAVVDAAGIAAVADPSNQDERFDRVRIRRRLGQSDWIDPTALARSAGALAEADAALEWTADRLADERVRSEGEGLSLDPADLPAELRRRLTLRLIRQLAPAAASRGEEVARLLDTLDAGGTATLAGIKCSGGARWHFERAAPRRAD